METEFPQGRGGETFKMGALCTLLKNSCLSLILTVKHYQEAAVRLVLQNKTSLLPLPQNPD